MTTTLLSCPICGSHKTTTDSGQEECAHCGFPVRYTEPSRYIEDLKQAKRLLEYLAYDEFDRCLICSAKGPHMADCVLGQFLKRIPT